MASGDLFPVNVMVRVWIDGSLAIEERHAELALSEIDAMAVKHIEAAGDEPFMVEFEFMDEADPRQRFLRFGASDPTGTVMPPLLSYNYPD